ncbi:MAG: paraquat-inducible protein A [Pseudomonadota bacterium]
MPSDQTPIAAPEELIGCPNCDQLYRVRPIAARERATCERCHTVLISPRPAAFTEALAFSVANLVLVVAAVFYPFLEIEAGGFGNRVSLLDVATSFGSGILVVVSVASVAMIVLVPLLRMALVAYVVAPLSQGMPPFRGAGGAFRLAQEMKPWAMTEIFAIGCAVALVKVAGLARLEFGIAFWMFIALSIIVLFVDRSICSWSIWTAIEADRREQKP